MLNEIRTGPISALPGSVNPARGDKTGALVVSQGHGSFQEAVDGGNVYAVCNQVGVVTQASLSATTPVLTLTNPPGSEINAVIWYVGCHFNVIFGAIASVFVAVGTNTAAAPVTGTLTITHRNMKLGLPQGNKAIPFLAATLPAAPVAIGLLGSGGTGAVNLNCTIAQLQRWFNGSIVLQPGTNLSIQTLAASGAAGTFCEYIWEEVRI